MGAGRSRLGSHLGDPVNVEQYVELGRLAGAVEALTREIGEAKESWDKRADELQATILSAINRHETRIMKLENWRERQKGGLSVANVAWTLFQGLLFAALGGWFL